MGECKNERKFNFILPMGADPMNEVNSDYLVKKYPVLYEHRQSFSVGDGWFKILDELSRELTKIIEETGCSCRCSDVKEKYGTLRFHMDTETDEMSKLIAKAEAKSSETCEHCGGKGLLRGLRWVTTLCDKCYN
jgi:hypothetical protein